MKYRILLTPTIIASVVVFFLSSCGKHNSPTPTPPVNPDSTTTPTHPFTDTTLVINLTYPDNGGLNGQNYELIISESDGNLLDTVVAFNTPVSLTLKKKQELVDITTIIFTPYFNSYYVTTYKAVNPATWVDVSPGTQEQLTYPNSFPSTIYYTDMPAISDINSVNFSSLPAVTSSGVELIYDYNNDPTKLLVDYPGRPGTANYAYLQFPTLGLYSYHAIATAADTVDLAHLDTSILVNFTLPPQYSLRMPYLIGYPDTTDLTKYLSLYLDITNTTLADLQYPSPTKVPIQRYYLYTSATTLQNESATYVSTGNSIPTTLPYPATPIYSVNSSQTDSFSISFTQKPTDYEISWKFGNSYFYIIAPADSTVLHAQNVFNGLKSKLLQGQSTNSLSYLGFGYTLVPGISYSDYLTQQCDTVKVTTKPFPEVLKYYKSN
jgi:hypothetical protein